MSNVIKEFLVGVGLDASKFDDGERDVSGGLSRIQAIAGFAGAAMVTAFTSASSAAIVAGSRIDSFNLATSKLSSSPKFIYDLGNAFETVGGDADDAVSAIASLETAIDNFRLKGDSSAFDSLAYAGIDTSVLTQARDGEEILRMLSNIVPELNKDQQRLLQREFGFSDAAMQTLRLGQREFDNLINEVSGLTGNIQDSAEAAREFNEQLALTKLRMEGVSNTLAEKMLPAFAGILETANDLIDRATTPRDPDAPTAWENMLDQGVFGKDGGERREWHRQSWDGITGSVGGWIGDQRAKAIERSSAYRQSVMDGAVDNQDAIRATPDYNFYNSRNDVTNYQQPKIQNKLDVNLSIDGKALESTITGVVERRDQATIDDMQSTTAR